MGHDYARFPEVGHDYASIPEVGHDYVSFPEVGHDYASFPECGHSPLLLLHGMHLYDRIKYQLQAGMTAYRAGM